MRYLRKSLPVCLILLVIAVMAPAVSAQSEAPAMAGVSSGGTARMVTGELLRVDTTNQTFTVRDTKGEEIHFRYDSSTQVEGSSEGVQGLSSQTGTQVTVHYEEKSGQKMATRIEIKKNESNG